VPFVVYQFGDFSLDCGKFELCRKGRRLKLERKPLELLVLLVTKHGQLLPGMKLPGACGNGKSSSISNTESTRQSVKFAKFLVTVRTCRGLCRQSPALVTASSQPLRALSQKSPSQLNLLGIWSTCLQFHRRSLLPPVIPTATKPHHRLWVVTALCACVLITISLLTLGPHPLAARFLDRDTHAAIASLAVLPLNNLSGDPNEEYFADGMTDELTTMLVKDSTLRIVSRTPPCNSRTRIGPLPEIARPSTLTPSSKAQSCAPGTGCI